MHLALANMNLLIEVTVTVLMSTVWWVIYSMEN
jgi:hypothetical protein